MFAFAQAGLKAKLKALDLLRANVMLADEKLNITYMNRSLLTLLREAEDDVKKEMPQFNVKSLIGRNIDVFHKHPSHQRTMLKKLETPHFATIHVGKRVFDLHVTPLMNGSRRTGFAVEWLDAIERLENLTFRGQIAAIDRSQAIIEFTTDGIVVRANKNFLLAMGYKSEDIIGKHHRIFVDPTEAKSPDYENFWKNLARGEFQAGEFPRYGKAGNLVWIQGAYDPIFDAKGKVTSIIKYARDVTSRVHAVNSIGAGLKALANKNLQYRLTSAFTPEFEPVRQDFNASLENLETTMTAITANTQAVHAGAGEITQASDDLSRRTEQQAANLEETSAALDQIAATVRKTSENAIEARSVATATKSNAERSGDLVNETVSAMNHIESSSKNITNIIGLIDEIAFQTNLLALNAGVEAARAGDAGRGFAVVATEVRALAQRSADAAKEIKNLISVSSQQVDRGVKLVAETGKALVGIVEQVAKLNNVITDIAASAREQSTGLDEINSAVNQMDQVTQQNAAMVEQATAASHSLTGEAEELNRLVNQFQISHANHRHRNSEPSLRDVTKPTANFKMPVRAATGKPKLAAVAAAGENWDEF